MFHPHPRPIRMATVALAASALVLTACGDDKKSSDTTTAADSTTAATATAGTTAATSAGTANAGTAAAGGADEQAYIDAGVTYLGGDPATSECVITAIVDTAGIDAIQASGVEPTAFWNTTGPLQAAGITLDEAQTTALAGDIAGCGELVNLLADSAGMTADEAACASEYVDDEAVGMLLATSVQGQNPPDDVTAAFDEVSANCNTPTTT